MVTSEIDSFLAEELGPKSTDPGAEDVPEFASIMRSPSSSGGELSRTEVSHPSFRVGSISFRSNSSLSLHLSN